MDENILIQDILQNILDTTHGAKAKRIRVVNLSVYDKDVDLNKLTSAFKTLTFSTMAHDAHLHIRRGEGASNPTLGPLPSSKAAHVIRLDSLELEDVSPESR